MSLMLLSPLVFYTGCTSSKKQKQEVPSKVAPAKEQAAHHAYSGSGEAHAKSSDEEVAYTINGKVTTRKELESKNPGWNYETKRREHSKLADIAYQEFLEQFWAKEAKKTGKSAEKAKEGYLAEHAKVEDRDMNLALAQVKNHPRFKDLKEEDRRKQVRGILLNNAKNKVMQDLLAMAVESGDIVLPAEPQEPRYNVELTKNDVLRFGPKDTDTKPVGCSGNDCLVKIVEHSEYQCPYCSRVPEIAKKILEDERFKGKVVWVVRDFPLDFHPRAEPAAIAARCAGFQGKFWPMYHELFANQRNLSDKDFEKYANKIKLDMKQYKSCVNSPERAKKIIAENMKAAQKIGITGTPGFVVNGRKITGLLPEAEFKKLVEEELKLAKKREGNKAKL